MLPDATHLQFLMLSVLLNKKRTGRDVRAELANKGQKKTLAAFYQLMSRMEESGWIKGWYETKHINGQTVKERHYEILGAGIRTWESTRDFYAGLAGLGIEGAV